MDAVETPIDLDGSSLGPVEVAVTADRVALYVDATGDDPARWSREAPPGFGSVLLFAVADEFLYHPDVIGFTATLLHLDQSFTYLSPIRIGTVVSVTGTVSRVRERGGSYFVAFESVASDDDGVVMESRSTFVLSDQQAPKSEHVHHEPTVRLRAVNDGLDRSASRHDLVRYAAATRDFNPFHWDHDFAVASGLPGTVVHGLLMYAWLMQAAQQTAGGRDVSTAKVRFRSALHPAQQAAITSEAKGDAVALTLSRDGDQLVTGTATFASRQG